MFEIQLSESQRAIYKGLSKNVPVRTGSSIAFLRELVRMGNKMVQDKKADINARVNKNNDTLSKRLADEANSQLQQELSGTISDIRTVLSKRTTELFTSKRNAVDAFVKQMPSDSLGKKLQYICEYGHLFNKPVWEIFIKDPEIAGNYVAQIIVQKKAEEHGIEYVTAFNYDRVQDGLNEMEELVNNAINGIGEDANLTLMSFISDNPDGPISQLIADHDRDISCVIPAERKTILNRLKEAQKRAYDADDVRLSARIKTFIEMHTSELSSPEELRDELLEQAEEYIRQGMSAKKGNA